MQSATEPTQRMQTGMSRKAIIKTAESLALAFVMAMMTGTAWATTLMEMDIDRVAQDAELIFEGEVLEHQVLRDDQSNLIHTYVSFAVREVVKGDYDADILELRFAGGSIGGEIVAITGMSIPPVGEQGIYFVESVARPLLNPLLGWSQGRFIIDDSGVEPTVLSADRAPIVDVQSMDQVPASLRRPKGLQHGDEVAAGIQVDRSELRSDEALSVEEFKTRIRGLLQR